METNHWGPVPFVIAYALEKTPNYPTAILLPKIAFLHLAELEDDLFHSTKKLLVKMSFIWILHGNTR